MTSFIDTHCHLDKLDSSPEEAVFEAKKVGVDRMVTISVDESSLDFVSRSVKKFPEVFGSVGFHPHEALSFKESHGEKMCQLLRDQEKLIAIGETGLDYHYMYSPIEVQKKVFRKHLQLANVLDLPVILHSREAEEDTINILKDFPEKTLGVAHSFTGSLVLARKLVDMGWYIGINGIVTFKNADDLREVVQWLPLDKLLLETDSPFLTPVPFRGKPNKPAHIIDIANFVANLKNIPIEDLAEKTSENAQNLFNFGNRN